MEGIILLTAVCIGIIVFAWVKYLLFLKSRCPKSGYILIPCTAQTKDLEKKVRAYYWEEVFEGENLGREILLVIMERSENDYIAKRLAQELSIVSTVDISGLQDYIKKKNFRCRSD